MLASNLSESRNDFIPSLPLNYSQGVSGWGVVMRPPQVAGAKNFILAYAQATAGPVCCKHQCDWQWIAGTGGRGQCGLRVPSFQGCEKRSQHTGPLLCKTAGVEVFIPCCKVFRSMEIVNSFSCLNWRFPKKGSRPAGWHTGTWNVCSCCFTCSSYLRVSKAIPTAVPHMQTRSTD